MIRNNPHSDLVNEILLAVGGLPYVRCWKNSTGTAKSFSGNVIRFGLEGSSDIIGILQNEENIGLFLGLEIKTGNATQNKHQKNFQAMVEKMGGLYKVCRSVEDATQFVGEQRCRKLSRS